MIGKPWVLALGVLSGCFNESLYDAQRVELEDRDADGVVAREDCDESDPEVHPGAPERCNGVDDNCDGVVDEGLTYRTWYFDGDGDGAGDPTRTQVDCTAPVGHVEVGEDCDDLDPDVHPDAAEIACNDTDDDCSEATPDAMDADGDGVFECEDCDDSDASSRPGGTEVCDGRDNDCNGVIDDEAVDAEVFYGDSDGDGFGDGETTITACVPPVDFAAVDGDCDDTDPEVRPDAPEDCEPIDRDCDGDPYEGAPANELSIWYFDGDGDFFGRSDMTLLACDGGVDFVLADGDCDDDEPSVWPGADELCAGDVDDDCDGLIDDDDPSVVDPSTWYRDFDLDGAGDPTVTAVSCDPVVGFVELSDDCDDSDPGVFPGGVEYAADGIDGNCDGLEVCFSDQDGDGYGDGVVSGPLDCMGPMLVGLGGDCNDADPAVHPGALEIPGDGVDDNCDGEDACFADVDSDGFGTGPALIGVACTLGGTADRFGDCDDGVATTHPGAIEVPGDGIDQDCDGVDVCFADLDADGFGIGGAVPAVLDCSSDPAWAVQLGDCGPGVAEIHPGAAELAGNQVDEDCDGVDHCFVDLDSDGYGVAPATAGTDLQCSGALESSLPGDCADDDPTRNPGVVEVFYDGIDSDCDLASDFDADGDSYDSEDYGGTDCQDDNPGVFAGLGLQWTVPGDFATPAEAVDLACDSDAIVVAAGTYFGGMHVVGKSLDLSGDPMNTVVIAEPGERVLTIEGGSAMGFVLQGGEGVQGGCVAVDGDGVLLDELLVSDCVADEGGGLWLRGADLVVRSVTVSSSTALVGGGVHVVDVNTQVLFEGLQIDNTSADFGGGVAVTGGAGVVFQGASFRETQAVSDGGAIGLLGAGVVSVNDVDVREASAAGGALLYQDPTSGTVMFERVEGRVLHGVSGPALQLEGVAQIDRLLILGSDTGAVSMRSLDIRHATLAGNVGDGLVTELLPPTSLSHGLILAFNGGAGLRVLTPLLPPDAPIHKSDLFGNLGGDWVGANGAGQDGNLSLDPLLQFFPTTNGPDDWNGFLGEGSPCIDAVLSGLDPDGSAADMGAFGGAGAVAHAYYDDLDADGLPDGWELRHGVADALSDLDGDGLSNLEEYLERTLPGESDSDGDGVDDALELGAGTDPRDALSL